MCTSQRPDHGADSDESIRDDIARATIDNAFSDAMLSLMGYELDERDFGMPTFERWGWGR